MNAPSVPRHFCVRTTKTRVYLAFAWLLFANAMGVAFWTWAIDKVLREVLVW
jgi:hypothetical protein